MIEIINLIRKFHVLRIKYIENRVYIMRMTVKETNLLLKCSNTLVVNLYIPIIICSIIVRVENYKL